MAAAGALIEIEVDYFFNFIPFHSVLAASE